MTLPTNMYTPLVFIQMFLLPSLIILELLFVYHFVHASDEFQEGRRFKHTVIISFVIAVVINFLALILTIIEAIRPGLPTRNLVIAALAILFISCCVTVVFVTLVTTRTNTVKYKKDWKYALLAVVLAWILFFVMFITLGTLWKFDYAILSFFICCPMFISNVVHGLVSDGKVSGISNLLNISFSILAAYVGIQAITSNSNFWFTSSA